MSQVYILNAKPRLDYSAAKMYGKLIPITSGSTNFFKPQQIITTLETSLQYFTDEDFLLISGNSFPALLTGIILAIKVNSLTVINVLVYDSKNAKYIHYKLDLDKVELYNPEEN